MGTTFTNAKYYKNGKVDRKMECDSQLNFETEKTTNRVLKSTMKGSVYYAAVETVQKETGKREVWAAVFKTYGQDRKDPYFNFGYKGMDESMGPCYYDCPASILDLLTPTDSEYANNWREKCRKGKKHIEIGQSVKWTRWNGETKILVKHAPMYQFKTWFWYCPDTNTYVSKKLVKDESIELMEV
jgi:hypothetical protein